MIETAWGEREAAVFPVDIAVQAHDRRGLLRDIGDALPREDQRHGGAHPEPSARGDHAVHGGGGNRDHLQRALAQIGEVRGVFSAARR